MPYGVLERRQRFPQPLQADPLLVRLTRAINASASTRSIDQAPGRTAAPYETELKRHGRPRGGMLAHGNARHEEGR